MQMMQMMQVMRGMLENDGKLMGDAKRRKKNAKLTEHVWKLGAKVMGNVWQLD